MRTHQLQSVQAEVVERHRGLVQATAMHYAMRCHEPLEDLIQEGWIGFLRACERFKPQRQSSLGAYAKPFIRGAILRHLRDRSRLVRLPRSTQERLQQLRVLKTRAEAETKDRFTSCALTPCTLSHLTGWSEAAVVAIEQAEQLNRLLPLEPERCEASSRGSSGEPALDAETVQSWLASIQKHQRKVVELVVLEGFSLRRTGAELGVSAATVRRRLQAGLEGLRTQLDLNPASGAPRC